MVNKHNENADGSELDDITYDTPDMTVLIDTELAVVK